MINSMIKNFDDVKKAVEGTGKLTVSMEFSSYGRIMLRPDILLDLFENKKVIHLGCTDHLEIIQKKIDKGNYLHSLISYVSKKCVGIDINNEALDYITRQGIDNVYYGDITGPSISQISEDQWDYILLGEVLEHTDNPVDFLASIIKNYGKHINAFVITVPNAFGLPYMLNAINAGREVINSDHRYWFTPYTLWKVINQAGLKLTDIEMCLSENSTGLLNTNEELLKSKPILLDTIVAICSVSHENKYTNMFVSG